MTVVSRTNKALLKEEIIKWRIKVRKFQREAIHKCLPGKPPSDIKVGNANDKTWDVILFIAGNGSTSVPLRASDIYLGTDLPKRTVIRIIDKLEALNVIKKTTDARDGRVTRIGFSTVFARLLDNHLEDCCVEWGVFVAVKPDTL
ncbi:MAG: MarR family transcriptional regulator [Rhodospirillales bacterium]|nr:MarR family transcriptional regulator [Rhodospirillales bacterium]